MFMDLSNACGSGGWLGDGMMVNLVCCGGCVGWWCLSATLVLCGWVEVGCSGHGGFEGEMTWFDWERKGKEAILGILSSFFRISHHCPLPGSPLDLTPSLTSS